MNKKNTFAQLIRNELLTKTLKSLEFHDPTPVQEMTLPLIYDMQDVICQSSTGSGKTLAFAIPIVENINPRDKLQAVVLVPTRELCEQVTEEFRKITKFTNINTLEVYGGVSIDNQIRKIPSAHIVVATPGRLLDLINRRVLNLRKIKTVVLDEADRMLDMGFINDVETILEDTPRKRQTLMFSATIPPAMEKIIRRHMWKPQRVKIKEQVDKHLLKQFFYQIPTNKRIHLLVYLLKNEKKPHAIIFCQTRRVVDLVAHNLNKNGVHAQAIHGGLTQNKRKKIISSFHAKETNILVASDIAARGLDIKLLTHVYNFDVPRTPEDYIHRIGRTARAGEEGIAITLVSEKDYKEFKSIERNPKLKILKMDLPEFPLIDYQRALPRRRQHRVAPRQHRPHKRRFNYRRRR
jgi:ATP-dependent RNA helicase DeaD